MLQLILALFISVNGWSYSDQTSNECRSGTSMKAVKKCLENFTSEIKSIGQTSAPCTTTSQANKPIFPVLTEEFDVGDKATCTSFIEENGDRGEYGPWGDSIVKYLDEQGEGSIFFSNDLEGMDDGVMACPNWKNMSISEKKHFWVWVKASISKIESGCDPKARNGGSTNGVAIGLVQLDERYSQRSWRGPNCKSKTVSSPVDNLRCGMDILGELLKGKKGEYKGNGELWGRRSGSYWQHMRQKNGGGISDLIQLNPYCKK